MYEDVFMEAVERICEKDTRYSPDAYFFVQEALGFTARLLDKPSEGPERHVTGRELLKGIREYSLREFGPMALTVLKSWGIGSTEDFGEIVFNLVESGKLGSTEEDKREDFANGYDFHETFTKPFLPATLPKKQMPRRNRRASAAKPVTKTSNPKNDKRQTSTSKKNT